MTRPTCPRHPGIVLPCYKPECQPKEEPVPTAQQTLTGFMWDAYQVPAVKLGVSGSLELPMDVVQALDLTELDPGENVVLTIGCTVRRIALDHADGKQTGLVSLRLVTVRGAEVVSGD